MSDDSNFLKNFDCSARYSGCYSVQSNRILAHQSLPIRCSLVWVDGSFVRIVTSNSFVAQQMSCSSADRAIHNVMWRLCQRMLMDCVGQEVEARCTLDVLWVPVGRPIVANFAVPCCWPQ